MTAKEYLNRAFLLDQRVNLKIEQIRRIRDLSEKCTSLITGMPKTKNGEQSRLEEAVCRIMDCENELNTDIDKLVDVKREITQAIDSVPDVALRTLLEMRYLCFKSWDDIAVEMFVSANHVFKMHRLALQYIDEYIKSDSHG